MLKLKSFHCPIEDWRDLELIASIRKGQGEVLCSVSSLIRDGIKVVLKQNSKILKENT